MMIMLFVDGEKSQCNKETKRNVLFTSRLQVPHCNDVIPIDAVMVEAQTDEQH